jgi:hypothetical protein
MCSQGRLYLTVALPAGAGDERMDGIWVLVILTIFIALMAVVSAKGGA